jgi:hypothetical protein
MLIDSISIHNNTKILDINTVVCSFMRKVQMSGKLLCYWAIKTHANGTHG